MLVRVRLKFGGNRPAPRSERQAALVLSTLMTPVALMAWALAAWRLASDLNWTGPFAIPGGVFSHWQVWVALAIGVQFASYLLQRTARREVKR